MRLRQLQYAMYEVVGVGVGEVATRAGQCLFVDVGKRLLLVVGCVLLCIVGGNRGKRHGVFVVGEQKRTFDTIQ